MGNLKAIKFILCSILIGAGSGIWAQLPSANTLQMQQKSIEQRLIQAVRQVTFPARGDLSVQDILQEQKNTGKVNTCRLVAVSADRAYLDTLDGTELLGLANAFAYADLYQSKCLPMVSRLVLDTLSHSQYDETAYDFWLYSFYANAAVYLGYNVDFYDTLQQWAFGQVAQSGRRTSDGTEGVWAAVVLSNIAMEYEEAETVATYHMSRAKREAFEKQLRGLIAQFDWLKNERADYLTPHIKSSEVWHKSNQTVLLELFAQVNGFVAKTREALTIGGNILGSTDFSSEMKNFYLHHPTPGTDGRGHWADSPNGRKHHILALLVQALSLSYAERGDREEISCLLSQFVREYIKPAPQGGFARYLFVALHALRNGDALLDHTTINGWEAGRAAKIDLYKTIRKEYPGVIRLNAVQGVAETAVEWDLIGGIFAGVFKGIGFGGKMIGRAVTNKLPPQTLMKLAGTELRIQHAVRAGKAGIKTFMHKAGWKAMAAGGGAVVLSADKPARTENLAY